MFSLREPAGMKKLVGEKVDNSPHDNYCFSTWTRDKGTNGIYKYM